MPAESHIVSTAADHRNTSQGASSRPGCDYFSHVGAYRRRQPGRGRVSSCTTRRGSCRGSCPGANARTWVQLALAGVPVAVKEVTAIAGEYPAWESPSTARLLLSTATSSSGYALQGPWSSGRPALRNIVYSPRPMMRTRSSPTPGPRITPPVVRRAAAQPRSPPGSCLWPMARTHSGRYVCLLRCAAWWVSHREPTPLPRRTLGSIPGCIAMVPLRRRFLMRHFCFRCWPNGRNWPQSLRRE